MSQRLWVSGYRSYELNIFKDNDPKLQVVKKALHDNLINLLDEGLEWLITGGQLGVEQWSVAVAHDLQIKYPQLKIAVILPFSDFGKNWNETNQLKLQQTIEMSNYHVFITKKPYQTPRQLRIYQQFMLQHTDQALLVYDPDHIGKSQYDYATIKKYQDNHDYNLRLIDMDILQTTAEEWQMNQKADE